MYSKMFLTIITHVINNDVIVNYMRNNTKNLKKIMKPCFTKKQGL